MHLRTCFHRGKKNRDNYIVKLLFFRKMFVDLLEYNYAQIVVIIIYMLVYRDMSYILLAVLFEQFNLIQGRVCVCVTVALFDHTV